jgi:DNA-binding response OmpR family regulator
MGDKVLIVDDDEAIRKLLAKVLSSNGIDPDTAANGEQALQCITHNDFQLILLDIMMPEMDGFQLIQKIRKQGITVPVIVISGRNEDYDALYGLDIGADDYIMKPFNPVILGAKVKALIRRNKIGTESEQQTEQHIGPFTFNTKTMRLYKHEQEIMLSARELQMMRLFLDNPRQVFSKEMLYERVWGTLVVDENAIMVYINHLRNKIEDNPKNPAYIQTVWGLGYSFMIPERENHG